jgi:hypothetical protein
VLPMPTYRVRSSLASVATRTGVAVALLLELVRCRLMCCRALCSSASAVKALAGIWHPGGSCRWERLMAGPGYVTDPTVVTETQNRPGIGKVQQRGDVSDEGAYQGLHEQRQCAALLLCDGRATREASVEGL